jgi:hypothetical protein
MMADLAAFDVKAFEVFADLDIPFGYPLLECGNHYVLIVF